MEELKRIQNQPYIEFVQGKGKRKTPLQRAVEEYLEKLKKYNDYSHSFGNRNSFSKTDRDATFMRMKDDHMRNGQLKPAYNVNIAVDSEYIMGVNISSERNDSGSLIPFLNVLTRYGYKKHHSGRRYESEENYTHIEKNGLTEHIKPANHDKSSTIKNKSDISRRENMPYDCEKDECICHTGKAIKART